MANPYCSCKRTHPEQGGAGGPARHADGAAEELVGQPAEHHRACSRHRREIFILLHPSLLFAGVSIRIAAIGETSLILLHPPLKSCIWRFNTDRRHRKTSVVLLQPPLPLAGVSIRVETYRERQREHNDDLKGGWWHHSIDRLGDCHPTALQQHRWRGVCLQYGILLRSTFSLPEGVSIRMERGVSAFLLAFFSLQQASQHGRSGGCQQNGSLAAGECPPSTPASANASATTCGGSFPSAT